MKREHPFAKVGNILDKLGVGILIGVAISGYASPATHFWPWIVAFSVILFGAFLLWASHRSRWTGRPDKDDPSE